MKTRIGTKTFCAAVVGAAAFAMNANADLVACWNFNSYAGGSSSIAADQGSGTLNLSMWGGPLASTSGTTMNAMPGDPAGNALQLQRGNPGPGGNGTPIEFVFSMSGFQDLTVSFATVIVGNFAHAFTTGSWEWSIDGISFNAIAGNTAATSMSWEMHTVDLSSIAALNDATTVTLRYTLDGAGHQNGRVALDNVQLNASLIPAPGALALLGVAAFVGVRRRRVA